MYTYKLSLKKQSYPRHISYLEDFLQKVKDKYPRAKLETFFEHDPHGIIHFHAQVTSKRKLYIRELRKLLPYPNEYNINLSLIESECEKRNWFFYIRKNAGRQINAINEEHEIEFTYRQLMDSMNDPFNREEEEGSEDVPVSPRLLTTPLF